MMQRMRYAAALAAGLIMGAASPAFAITSMTPGSFAALSEELVKTTVESVGIGASHRAMRSATPLGMIIGVDVSGSATLFQVPDDLKAALAAAQVQNAPSTIPLPRLSIAKGLPFGVDLGFSWIGDGTNSLIGADIQYAFLQGGLALPSVAARVGMNWANIAYIKTRTTAFDVLVSKSLPIIDPYVGAGYQFVSGSLDAPVGGATGLQVSGKASSSAPHLFVGLPIKLFVLKITGEYDYSFAGISTYGLKVGLAL